MLTLIAAIDARRGLRQQFDNQVRIAPALFPNDPRSPWFWGNPTHHEKIWAQKAAAAQFVVIKVDRQVGAKEVVAALAPVPIQRRLKQDQLTLMQGSFHLRLVAI
jgi:hypothetical protein